MSHSETRKDYFDEVEDAAITRWLDQRGLFCYDWNDEFWVELSPAYVNEFNEFAKANGISAVAWLGGIEVGETKKSSEAGR